MCNEKDARRHETLAELYLKENNQNKAREHFLEAASIYVLQAELQKKDILINQANKNYKKSLHTQGIKNSSEFSKQELARRTLQELAQLQKKTNPEEVFAQIKAIL
jgi:hypothetical protein